MWIYAAYELRSRIAAFDGPDDVSVETFRQALRDPVSVVGESAQAQTCLREVPLRSDLRHRCRRCVDFH